MIPVKPWYLSKTIIAAIITVLIAIYSAWAPARGLPPVPAEVYAVLGALGLYGLRLADTTIGQPGDVKKPDNVLPSAATASQGGADLPDAAAVTHPAGAGTFQDPGAGDGSAPATIQPLLGLPDLSGVGALLGSPVLESVVKMALTAAGLGAGKAELLAVGYKLARLAPDLLDGNPMLSTDNLNIINGVVLDLKADYRGGSQ